MKILKKIKVFLQLIPLSIRAMYLYGKVKRLRLRLQREANVKLKNDLQKATVGLDGEVPEQELDKIFMKYAKTSKKFESS